MYGYDPKDDEPRGTWAETFLLIKVVFQVLAGPLALLFGSLALVVLTFAALITNPLLALIPLGAMAAGIWYLVRRDKRVQAEMQEEIERGRRF